MKIEKIELPEELKEQFIKFIEGAAKAEPLKARDFKDMEKDFKEAMDELFKNSGIGDCKNCEAQGCKNRKEAQKTSETEPKKTPDQEKIKWVVPKVSARTLTKEEDEAEGVELTVELPGIDEEDLSLKIVDRCIVIEAKGVYKDYKFHSSPLPKEIDEKSAEADFDAGLLTVFVYQKKVESFDIPVNQ